MTAILFPAIDLIDGKCVRLIRGDYKQQTNYNANPIEQALEFQDAGASWIHVVDLDAAKTGIQKNFNIIEKMSKNLDIPMQVGGGIRSVESAISLFEAGIERVIVGTAAIENFDLVSQIIEHGKLAIGIDLKKGKVAVHGWTATSEVTFSELILKFKNLEIDAYVVTHIERDGTMNGPGVKEYEILLSETKNNLIASGGVGSLKDLEDLGELASDSRKLCGVIVGKALYENKFSLSEGIRALKSK